jgi:decaprenylphospho-beta-D-erythro-pentofuranosid-2-ulose 2-reductase
MEIADYSDLRRLHSLDFSRQHKLAYECLMGCGHRFLGQNLCIESHVPSKLEVMKSIYLFGGRSELGNHVATAIMSRTFGEFSKLIKIQRDSSTIAESEHQLLWQPNTVSEVSEFLTSLSLKKGDLMIVAPGIIHVGDSILGLSEIEPSKIHDLVWINFTLPLLVITHASRELRLVGGGDIIVFTSAAAFPPQPNALIYSHVKRALDGLLRASHGKFRSRNVRICLVRSAFSGTKLNAGRTPTPFSVSPLRVGQIVANRFLSGKDVIWVPAVFRLISFSLRFVPGLQNIANRIVEASRQNR